MPGKREEITAELLHIHLFMGSTLRTVKNNHCPVFVRPTDQSPRIDRKTKDVAYMGKGKDLYTGIVNLFQFSFRKTSCFLIHIHILKNGPCLLCRPLPGDEVRVVFRNGNEDAVAFFQMGFPV